ncbi:hypothetical protein IEZ26_13670 [Nocardioides cavernae]|uniref:DUF2169 domain-containing protein n=1 Tax=Nocardioides cavernae TaxID=1921566 RepID=A0ABR8NC25_9ACTN|nr:hypothetical protein [Nocardioides cavernae]MBD3925676.1 hypothetical protein [Nocardioides cavernae]MBM7513260.1 hypothetical protein [Nocardioides cavernae]
MNTTVAAHHEPWSKRPLFAPRQLLDADRLNAALDDELERQRVLNLALHGWGVVFGFGVELRELGRDGQPPRKRLLVGCGVALDPFGRMLRTDDRLLSLADVEGSPPKASGRYTLVAHHAERLDPPDHDSCGSASPQWREYGVVYTLRHGCEPPGDGCPPLPDDECLSRTDYVRRRIGSAREKQPGLSKDLEHACERPGSLQATRCGSWCYDKDAGVPIACVEIRDLRERVEKDGADPGGDTAKTKGDGWPESDARCLVIDRVCTDECSPVPHVYRNPLLLELLNCCDVALPRVERVSWPGWAGSGGVSWDEFSTRIQVVDEGRAADGLAIWFTRPVRANTLTTASVLLTALTQEELADYWTSSRVPIEVRPLEPVGELARGVQLVADREWLAAEVTGRRSSLTDGFRLEITLRGQLLRDDCGHMLDAVPTDLDCTRCQRRPGDDLIWAFEVGERDARYDSGGAPDKNESTRQGES